MLGIPQEDETKKMKYILLFVRKNIVFNDEFYYGV